MVRRRSPALDEGRYDLDVDGFVEVGTVSSTSKRLRQGGSGDGDDEDTLDGETVLDYKKRKKAGDSHNPLLTSLLSKWEYGSVEERVC